MKTSATYPSTDGPLSAIDANIDVRSGMGAARAATLDDVVTTEQLQQRPTRPANYQAENRALVELVRTLAGAPATVFQKLVDLALQLTGADSAGISVFEMEGENRIFRWRATAGAFARFTGGTMPRDSSPCGVVLDRNATQLMADPVRQWPYMAGLQPGIAEVLLVPFYEGATPVGTVWVVAHSEAKRFDAEDVRVVSSLAQFASAAVQSAGQREALETANRSKDQFLAVLSHELRTPLTPVLMTAQAMQDDESLSAAVRDHARMIGRNIEIETALIDDLLDVSRAATGKVELHTQLFNLHDLLRECAAMVRPAPGRPAVRVEPQLEARRPIVSGDPTRLRQVFCNLLSNAVKFTPDGGQITIRTTDAEQRIRIDVADNGVGIEPAALARIFEPFQQGSRDVTRQ
jgi:signal transduction histidine kinase